ncbi:phage tail protein [Natrinema ejinorense]|uniref:Phage tail protein n=1 Tax=Natrinema ejinorense TaxID=373386 RepID=A0A2A5QZJ0_9EURY|nr:phage tail protein [Natrinema ejinorense]PCR92246.1 phage tail protein [Natrinema ejinorense]
MDFSYATTTSTADWTEWVGRNVDVRDEGLGLATTAAIERTTIEDGVVDVAMDPSGDLYTLRSSGALYRHDPAADLTQRLWTRSDGDVADPSALCVDDDRVFIVDRDDGSITVVSPRLQRTIGTIETDATDPIRVAHAGGLLYLLDDVGRVQTVGRDAEIDLAIDWWLVEPTDLAVDADGRGYVLDRNDGDPVIRSFGDGDDHTDGGFPITSGEFVAGAGAFSPTALSVVDGTLFVAGRLENGGPALFERDASSDAFRERYRFNQPCRTLVARPTAPDDRREFYAACGPNGRGTLLRERRRHARHPRRERHVGEAFHRYDSGTDDTEWHRLAIRLSQLTASTQVRVRYLATNRPMPREVGIGDLEAMPADAVDSVRELGVSSAWELASADVDRLVSGCPDRSRGDVRAWRTGAIDALAAHAEADWTTVDSLNPDDVLLSDAVGRYLFVALELDGSPRSSPRVDSITAFCPRQTYLRYLPELYQEDDRSAAFLEQYLSVFESAFVDIETAIEDMGRYFDPEAVPSDALSWLEQWLAVEPDGDWPEDARRELLARAPELYRQRGTKAGLRAMLVLYLRYAGSESTARSSAASADDDDGVSPDGSGPAAPTAASDGGDGTVGDTPSGHRLFFFDDGDLECIDRQTLRREYPLPESSPQSFVVFCGPFETDDERRTVERIVLSGKPAHVTADVVEIDDELTLDSDTFLGVNSRLTAREFSLGETTLGEDTVLTAREGSE